MRAFTAKIFPLLALLSWLSAQDDPGKGSKPPAPNSPAPPPITEIVRINEQAVFFLDPRGRIGVARFGPDLKLVDWDYYSDFLWEEARHLAVGRNLSIISSTPYELTQAFDTNQDARLDFFQDIITEWPGKDTGATISCGPMADHYGRMLFAIAPKARPEGAADDPAAETPPSALYAWNPGAQSLTQLATSSLPIAEMALSPSGRLAAWIQLPSYTEGYYLAIVDLPPFDPNDVESQPDKIPTLLPNIIIPASLTDLKPIDQLCFTREDGIEKILVTVPESSRLIEVVPELQPGGWGGLITVRSVFEKPVLAIEAITADKVLLGGVSGFLTAGQDASRFRFKTVKLEKGVLRISFTRPVDRSSATAPNGIQISIIPLEGQLEPFTQPEVVIESDGLTALLRLPKLPGKAIVKIDAPDLKSDEEDTGLAVQKLASPTFFYTLK